MNIDLWHKVYNHMRTSNESPWKICIWADICPMQASANDVRRIHRCCSIHKPPEKGKQEWSNLKPLGTKCDIHDLNICSTQALASHPVITRQTCLASTWRKAWQSYHEHKGRKRERGSKNLQLLCLILWLFIWLQSLCSVLQTCQLSCGLFCFFCFLISSFAASTNCVTVLSLLG